MSLQVLFGIVLTRAANLSKIRPNPKLTIPTVNLEGIEMDFSNLGALISVGGGAFLCGVAVMYVVMNRTWKKRDAERVDPVTEAAA